MATHSGTLAWKIPWTEEPGRLQSMGSLRVGHDWATSLSLFTFMHWRRKWQPTPVFLPGESQGRGSLVGFRLWGCTESDTLKQLSSRSSIVRYFRCLILLLHFGMFPLYPVLILWEFLMHPSFIFSPVLICQVEEWIRFSWRNGLKQTFRGPQNLWPVCSLPSSCLFLGNCFPGDHT